MFTHNTLLTLLLKKCVTSGKTPYFRPNGLTIVISIYMDKIHHIAIEVNNIIESVEWYQEQSNCTIAFVDETWALLEYDNIKLALVLPNQHPPHLAFEKNNAIDYGKLKTHRDGTKSVYIKDPSNNTIEILQS